MADRLHLRLHNGMPHTEQSRPALCPHSNPISAYLLDVQRTVFLVSLASLFLCAQTRVANSQTLPRHYIELKLDKQELRFAPIDSEVRLILRFTPDFDNGNPEWHRYAFGFDWSNVDRILHINIASPLREGIIARLERLFPKTKIAEGGLPPQYDLLVVPRFEVQTSTVENNYPFSTSAGTKQIRSSSLTELSGHLDASIFNRMGGLVTKISVRAQQSQIQKKRSLAEDSAKKMSRRMAEALTSTLLHLFTEKLMGHTELRNALASMSRDRAKPCTLSTSVTFVEDQYFRNSRLDATEKAQLGFKVLNEGPGPAYDVSLHVSSTLPEINVNAPAHLGQIEPGATASVRVPIEANRLLKDGVAVLRVVTEEARGFNAAPLDLHLTTSALQLPSLQVLGLSCSDCSGQATEEQLSNGARYERSLWISNSGPGILPLAHLSAKSLSPGARIILEETSVVGLQSGSTVSIPIHIEIEPDFSEPQARFTVQITDSRGSEIGSASKTLSEPVHLRRPTYDVSWRLDDGNLVGTKGNSNGVASNGETVALEVTLKNIGTLEGRDVNLTFSSLPGLTFQPAKVTVGHVLAGRRLESKVVLFQIPRYSPSIEGIEVFPIRIVIDQAYFQPETTKIELPFEYLLPELSLQIPSRIELQEGKRTDVSLRLSNNGALEAHGVEISASTEVGATKMLYNNGLLVPSVDTRLGTVKSFESIEIPLALGATPSGDLERRVVSLRVRQDDFPPIRKELVVSVIPREASTVTITPNQAKEKPREDFVDPVIVVHNRAQVVTGSQMKLEFQVISTEPVVMVTVQSSEGADLVDLNGGRRSEGLAGIRFVHEVRLSPGRNVLEISAATGSGRSGVARYIVERRDSAKEIGRHLELEVQDPRLLQILDSGSSVRVNGVDAAVANIDRGRFSLTFLGSEGRVFQGLNILESAGRRVRGFMESFSLRSFEEPYKSSYALLVAIDDYERLKRDGYPSLQGMVARAEDLRQVLQGLGFPRQNIVTLYNSDATSDAMERVLEEFWKGEEKSGASRLFVYFGGHGRGNEGQGYLVTYDFDPERPRTTSFLMQDIVYRHFSQFGVHHVLFAVDSCSAGLAIPGARTLGQELQGSGERPLALIRADVVAPARNLLVAGTGTEEALWENGGIFTKALIRGLEGEADLISDGVIQLDELALFVRNRVVSVSTRSGVSQSPQLFVSSATGSGRMLFLLER